MPGPPMFFERGGDVSSRMVVRIGNPGERDQKHRQDVGVSLRLM